MNVIPSYHISLEAAISVTVFNLVASDNGLAVPAVLAYLIVSGAM